jgi:hypothetical protein
MAKLKNTVIEGTLTIPSGTTAQRSIVEFRDIGTTTWTCPPGITRIQVLVVAGGGGGGGWGGGGGAGGVVYNPSFTVSPGTGYTVTVGAGGARGTEAYSAGGDGGASVFGSITAVGGGGGGQWQGGAGRPGGSGGGGSAAAGGAGTAGQGFAGGTGGSTNGIENSYMGHGGGGGAGGPGQSFYGPNNHLGGDGGPGIACAITGTTQWYAGGGGGHTPGASTLTIGKYALGGIGGGGNGGGYYTVINAEDGVNGTGGGGGGAWGGTGSRIGQGGSGIVIISFSQEVVEVFSVGGTTTTWTAPADINEVEVLVVGGGGAASGADYATGGGGGGGGGIVYNSNYVVSPGTGYTVTVGAGGTPSANGGNSVFAALTAFGGGRGAGYPSTPAGSGGSGGGGSWAQNAAGTGTSGQGYAGGAATDGHRTGGGGGGAGLPGIAGTAQQAGNGGDGLPFNITGTVIYYGGGGGGGAADWTDPPTGSSRRQGLGGKGGGGMGGKSVGSGGFSQRGGHGVDGLGGGAGGSSLNVSSTNATTLSPAHGGAGTVIIKYRSNTGRASAQQGQLRLNSTVKTPEVYTNSGKWVGLTGSAGGIVGDGLFFEVDAGNRRSKVFYPSKLIDDKVWDTGNTSIGTFGLNGNTTANQRLIDIDPWSNRSIVWEARAQATNADEGGWNTGYPTINPRVPHRLSVWVRRTVIGSGSFYFGTQNVRNISDGTNNGNPYFFATGWPYQQNQWYLLVGHCFPSNRAAGGTTLHPDSGVYTAEYGTFKVANMQIDYMLRNDAPSINHRTYLYYTTSTDGRQQWIRPRIDPLDGTQPSIEDLVTDAPVDPDIWYDTKGKNHCLMYNGVGYNSANGGSLTFNGSNQYARTQIQPNIQIPNGASVEQWIYLTAKDRNHGFFQFEPNGTLGYINFYMSTSNQMRWEIIGNTATSYNVCLSTTRFETGRWYHVVGTFNNGQTDLYINGIRESGLTSYTNVPTTLTSQHIKIGEYGGHCAANIAVTRIYTRMISALEVSQNFNAQRGRFGI